MSSEIVDRILVIISRGTLSVLMRHPLGNLEKILRRTDRRSKIDAPWAFLSQYFSGWMRLRSDWRGALESAVIDTPLQRGALRASGGVGGHRHTATKALDAGLSSLDDFVIFPNLRGHNALRQRGRTPRAISKAGELLRPRSQADRRPLELRVPCATF